ncbi:heparinase II/III family protein [Pectobacterium aroidearum]
MMTTIFITPSVLAAVPDAHEFNAINIFTRDTVVKNLKKDHPRLLMTGEDIKIIQEQVKSDEEMKKLVDEVIRRAEGSLNEPVIHYKLTGNDASPSLLDTSRKAIKIILDNAFSWKITGDARFARKAKETVLAVSDFPDWNAQSRFLDAGEMMFAVAIGYDWLYDQFSAEEEKQIREALLEKGINWGLKAYADKDPAAPSLGFPWWATNWNEVCNGGVLAAVLATAEHYPERTRTLLNNIIPSLKMGLDAYKPDGASAEGPIYWSYGMTYRIIAQEMLRSAFGQDYGLSSDTVLEKTPWYRFAIEGFSGDGFNYGDAVEDQGYTPVYAWFGNRYKQDLIINAARGQMQKALARSAAGKVWGEFDRFLPLFALWYPQAVSVSGATTQDNFLFHGPSALFIYKKQFSDGGNVWLGIKSGDNKANHAHQDLGSFVLEYDGVRWANDLGKDYYNLPGYFDNAVRPSYFRVSALSHNTLTFDGDNQDPNGVATLIWDEKQSTARLELTRAYPHVAENILREYQLDGKAITISDAIQGTYNPKIYRWAMVTTAEITIKGNTALLTKEGRTINVIKDDDSAEFRVLSTKPADNRQKDNVGTSMLAVQKEIPAKSDYRINVTITP